MNTTIERKLNELHKQINEAQAKVRELEQHRDALEANDPRAIAEYLHSLKCHLHHEDQCSWFYETWDGSTPAGNSERGRWLAKAEIVIAEARKRKMSPAELIELTQLI
jgi:hypothetical protein